VANVMKNGAGSLSHTVDEKNYYAIICKQYNKPDSIVKINFCPMCGRKLGGE